MAVCTPDSCALVYALAVEQAGNRVLATYLTSIDAVSVASIRATRREIGDMLVVKSDGSVSIFMHGLQEVPLQLRLAQPRNLDSASRPADVLIRSVISTKWTCVSSVTLTCNGGESYRGCFDMLPRDPLVYQALRVLALVLPKEEAFDVHRKFLQTWSPHHFWASSSLEFHTLSFALSYVLELKLVYPYKNEKPPSSPWSEFCHLSAYSRQFVDDPALARLTLPILPRNRRYFLSSFKPNPLLAPVLYALHMLAEDLRLVVHRYDELMLLVSLVCHIAHIVRPEWVDYWKRLCPDIVPTWPSPATARESDP